MYHHIRLLSDLSYSLGLIGLFEYLERSEVLNWLEDEESIISDPRHPYAENEENREEIKRPEEIKEETTNDSIGSVTPPDWMECKLLNKWIFTIGDRDCYPSIPHGHLHVKTREWPKLNPYTGRAFSDVHKEERKLRLDKLEMKVIWNDSKFVEHCREQVLWYSDFAQNYKFPRAKHGKLVFPRR